MPAPKGLNLGDTERGLRKLAESSRTSSGSVGFFASSFP
jgi:hypothetical protein